jgi:hypothetical protein
MHVFPLLFAALSVVSQVSGLPLLPDKAVVTKSNQHRHLQANYIQFTFDHPGVTKTLATNLKIAFDDETISYIKGALNRFMLYCKVNTLPIAATTSPISGKQIF